MALGKKSGLVLEHVVSADAEAISPLFFQAFHDHAYFRHMMPDTAEGRVAWAKMTRHCATEPNTISLKVTEEKTGKIISHGRWLKPKKPGQDTEPGHEEERWGPIGEYCDAETADALFGSFARNRAQMMEGRRHYYMELLMTAEGYKGLGAGSLILEYGCQKADSEEVECYIDASPAGKPLYERFGFEFTRKEELPLGYHYNFGIRRAQDRE